MVMTYKSILIKSSAYFLIFLLQNATSDSFFKHQQIKWLFPVLLQAIKHTQFYHLLNGTALSDWWW